jgi:hypothetical protein
VSEKCPEILPKCRITRYIRDLLHAVTLRHGTDGFTSSPKEGVLRIFFALKIRTLELGYQGPVRYLYTTEAAYQGM